MFCIKHRNRDFWTWTSVSRTFGAGSRAKKTRRIRIWGPFYLFLSSSVENVGKNKTIKKQKKILIFPLKGLYSPFHGHGKEPRALRTSASSRSPPQSPQVSHAESQLPGDIEPDPGGGPCTAQHHAAPSSGDYIQCCPLCYSCVIGFS